MEGLARRCIAAHLRHVSRDGDGIDISFPEPLFEDRAGKAAGKVFFKQEIEGTTCHIGSKLPLGTPFSENRRFRCLCRMLHDDDRNALLLGGIHRIEDVLKAVLWICYGQLPGEIFILHIYDQKRTFHGITSGWSLTDILQID